MTIEPITAVAVVGVGAILPDAPDAAAFWANVRAGRYSITDVDPERWDPAFYYDANPKAPDKTYSKIGGWVRDWTWDPLGWKLPIPPRVGAAMDDAQKWALAGTRAALLDYGWPSRPIDGERTAVILGNAMSGEKHYLTALRIAYPELAHELDRAPSFQGLPADIRKAISAEFGELLADRYPEITEDTMPGELGNCMAGRVANLFDLHGPNFVVDAACASALAAINASVAGLVDHSCDVAIAGGVDRNMGASSYVKFCKIGALSATGTRPFDAGADGFVMGEGAALFVLKRLADAERDGDRIYAVLRGIGGASDGRGKGITAPNPVGQRLAVERAWRKAGLSPADCEMVECHGTSTRVGDVVEVTSLAEAFAGADLAAGSVAIGSVKSNLGHLKAAAGAAGFLKAVMAIDQKELPPSLHVEELNPNIDWASSPFTVNTELRPWDQPADGARTAGVSAFGFGGTNFHVVLEEYVPGRVPTNGSTSVAVGADLTAPEVATTAPAPVAAEASPKAPLRGALVLGAPDEATLIARLRDVQVHAIAGRAPEPAPPREDDLRATERIAIDYADAADLADKAEQTLAAFEQPVRWKVLRGRGVFRGSGPAPKVAFLYTGQGSQYANMLATLRDLEPVVAETFDEADAVMTPLIGRPLTSYLFADPADPVAVAAAEAELRKTEITQPAVLSVDLALTRLLAAYGIVPDLVMGHSLGEYGALVAAGALTFPAALEAVSARGREMAHLTVEDNGAMAAVFAPLEEIERIVADAGGDVVIANVNSTSQAVIGGATAAVAAAVEQCQQGGFQTAMLPVSHAFHTSIVAPASEPLRRTLERLELRPPQVPIVSNVTGELYPMGPGVVPEMLDLLAAQVASPVQFVHGLRTLYDAGARVFVEVGPKKALQGFAMDVLGDEIVALATNHPKLGDTTALNQALCGLYAAGLGVGQSEQMAETVVVETAAAAAPAGRVDDRPAPDEPTVITGAALGLPGAPHVFDDSNVARILHGEQGIDVIPTRIRHEMLDRHITRLVKGEGGGRFETIDSPADVIKLAARAGEFDLGEEFGVDAERIPALGRETQLAIGAGIDALRDAGIPLVQHYRTTSVGTQLPDRWMLPDDLRDRTGVIFASAFPGYNDLADELTRFGIDSARRNELDALDAVRAKIVQAGGEPTALAELDRRIHDLQLALEQEGYTFDRRFLFRVLSMGHSQFAELIGARGPNTQVNAACASTTQAVALSEDWIRAGRCDRVVIVAADDVTSDKLLCWMGSGFLASGAAATDEDVEEAAVPFDRRRHGMILGMGAAAIVVERASAARQRGIRPICEVLGAVTANSAFHGTRLDVDHIGTVMELLVAQAEARGERREEMAPATVFISHETYTPARGGSAAAEVNALRRVFGTAADQVVVANTKGYTGHPMGVGIEDVVAVKALETGLVPPVPNFKEPDPDLGVLNLSIGGAYPVRYALRLAAGFGSQISMLLLRWVPAPDGRRPQPDELGYAGRIADPDAWRVWLEGAGSGADPQLEVDHRTLRLVARDVVTTAPAPAPAPMATVEPTAPVPAEDAEVDAAATPATVAAVPASEPVLGLAPLAAPPAPSGDDLAARVVALVAEQTGYPPELLDLDLDLEADLGIDTVKQAELFAQVRQTYGIARDDNLKLRDYPTLNHVITFVRDRTPQDAPSVVQQQPEPAETKRQNEEVEDPGFPRRVPVAVVRPPLEWYGPTGVHLGPGSRVVVLPDAGGVADVLSQVLTDRGVDVLTVEPTTDAQALVAQLEAWLATGPVDGLYALAGLDVEPPFAGMDIDQWRSGLHNRVKRLAATARVLYESLDTAGSFAITATRNGGAHGYDEGGALSPMAGAVSGFTKALARERPAALVKVLDVEAGAAPAEVAGILVDETLGDAGTVEIGRRGGVRLAIGLEERPAPPADPSRALGPDSVVVATGAAGSIVSAILADLARFAGGGTFHLLDLIAEPDPADPDLAMFASDRDGLKRELAGRIAARGERATPVSIERELAAIERRYAARAAIDAITAAGGTAHWHAGDLRDETAIGEAAAEIAAASDRVDVLLHAGGLEISRLLPDKSPDEFDLVFDVKVDGWFNLLHGLGDVPVGTAVVFSSIAGRFGNGGQTDYSAANDLLCKSVSSFRSARPNTRGVAIDWTAWAGIGMASRGSIPKMMALAGIDMLPPEIGIPVVRREVTAGGTGGEVVVAGSLGIMVETPGSPANPVAASGADPMVGAVAPQIDGGIVVTTDLDPAGQPFLDDHRIEGTPVLPGVMGMEAFAEASRLLAPGWDVAAIENVEFLAPFKWYRDQPRRLEVHVSAVPDGESLVATCRLDGRRTLPGQPEQVTTHFSGRVILRRTAGELGTAAPPSPPDGPVLTRDAIYKVFFHGPAYRVLARAWRDGDMTVGQLAGDLPPNHTGGPLVVAPRLVELCFQTAGVAQLAEDGTLGLPSKVRRLEVASGADDAIQCWAQTTTSDSGGIDAVVVDGEGRVLVRLSDYETIALPGAAGPDVLAPFATALR